jgi:hypothetical protein
MEDSEKINRLRWHSGIVWFIFPPALILATDVKSIAASHFKYNTGMLPFIVAFVVVLIAAGYGKWIELTSGIDIRRFWASNLRFAAWSFIEILLLMYANHLIFLAFGLEE